MFVPSILARYGQILVARDCNQAVLGSQIRDNHLLLSALAFPSLQHDSSYEKLEFFGDTVLKFIVSNHAFTQSTSMDEGELSMMVDKFVCNARLTAVSLRHAIPSYACARTFSARKWQPPGCEARELRMSRKGIADLVEALLGAAWMDGGLAGAFGCANQLELCNHHVSANAFRNAHSALQKAEANRDWAARVDAGGLLRLQDILGYTFQRPDLALEACTHASLFGSEMPSYQRLEFLGDAVLDLLVVETLHSTVPDLDEGVNTKLKGTAVANVSLAVACLDLGLHKFLQHGSPPISSEIADFCHDVERTRAHLAADEAGGNKSPFWVGKRAPKQLADVSKRTCVWPCAS